MVKQTELDFEGVEQRPLMEFTEQAYLNYSMYVILDRALPHLADGLKPVQRRIIYAMSELGLKATAKYKKSARTVGDVLGKFHPHGDSACYEAMVLMAQDFSYRYPLVDGQGNWGSPDDPKSFAAMRYTESRLAAYADTLLAEVDQGTVDWVPNFDGTLDEPQLLPARLPNILLNGTMGIAVGMTTDIPPHNLREVANACIHLLDHPNATIEQLCEHIPAPDYPTEAEIITPRQDLLEMYQRGQGSIKMRAVYHKEEQDIIITALPHQTSGAKVLEQIAQQMHAKKLPMIADLRDESDHENPTRLVIVPRSNRIDSDAVMQHLFATTDLEKSYRANLNMIGLNRRPQIKNLLTILTEWLEFRTQTVSRRLQYRLDKILARLHILEGLLIAFLNIDEVIAIIRHEDEPKVELIKRFQLSDTQAEAILDLKLRHLARLEEIKIRGEQDELNAERENLQHILSTPAALKKLIRKEIKEDADKYGNPRRSPLIQRAEAQIIKAVDLLPNEALTVVLSEKGWVRAAKGYEIDPTQLSYKAGDNYLAKAQGRSNELAIFIDSTGRSYSLPTHTLPSARGQGEPLTGRLNPPSGASFVDVLIDNNESLYIMASNAGYGFIIKVEELLTKNRNGKTILNLASNAQVLPVQKINNLESDQIAVVTSLGRLLVFPAKELPQLARGKGNKMLNIPTADFNKGVEVISAITVLNEQQSLILHTEKRQFTLNAKDLKEYQGERGRRGSKLPRGYQKIERLTTSE